MHWGEAAIKDFCMSDLHSAIRNPCLREAASAKAGKIRNSLIH
jgi:hypothetical protein